MSARTYKGNRKPGGLGDRINHISHFDVNVSDLERSRAFYEATMPLEAVERISARQAFPSLGIGDGHFEGYVMRSTTQLGDYPAIHLIEWKTPKPVGTPYRSHGNVGWYRIVPVVRDMERARAAAIAHGAQPFAPTTHAENHMWGPDVPPSVYRVFMAHDPDGIAIEWGYDWPRARLESSAGEASAEADREYWLPADPPLRDRVITVASQSTDVDTNLAFYTDVLGLDILAGAQAREPVPNVYSPGGGMTAFDGVLFVPRGDRRFFLDWLRWDCSPDNPTPYLEPNHLGIMRCAFEVDDADEAYRILADTRFNGRPIANLHPPEIWDLGPALGRRRVVNFTDPEGVAFQLIEEPDYPMGRLHPWGRNSFA